MDSIRKTRAGGTHFFTFYSFKGGVGRSMALLNTAALLAQRRRRVLVIDLDLEAPGISYLAADEMARGEQSELFSKDGNSAPVISAQSQPRWGFVDAIYDLIEEGENSPLGNASERYPFARYIHQLDLKEIAQTATAQRIWLMPAGRLDDISEYQRRLSALALKERYEGGEGVSILRHFKNLLQALPEPFDYILVDSRTGLSTEAGIAARDLGDHLVMVMGLNRQNREGSAGFLRMLRAGEPRPKTLMLIASPIPLGEDELASDLLNRAENDLSQAWGGEEKLQFKVLIPYHPRLALDEKPHSKRRTNTALTRAYSSLEKAITEIAGDDADSYRTKFITAIYSDSWLEAIEPLQDLIFEDDGFLNSFVPASPLAGKAGDLDLDTHFEILSKLDGIDLRLAELCASHEVKRGRFERAETILRTYISQHQEDPRAIHRLAKLWSDHGPGQTRFAEAEQLYRDGLIKHPNDSQLTANYAILLSNIPGRNHEAGDHYRHALELDPQDASIRSSYATFLWKEKNVEEAGKQYRKALKTGFRDANSHNNFASFLWKVENATAAAAVHYKQALNLSPQDAAILGNYGMFLYSQPNRLEEAEVYCRKALELDPDNPQRRVNCAEVLIARARWREAKKLLADAWNSRRERQNFSVTSTLFFAALLDAAQSRSNALSLGRIKTLLQLSSKPDDEEFDRVLGLILPQLPTEDQQFYQTLARVICGSISPAELDKLPAWRAIEPLALDGELFGEVIAG